MKEEINMIKYLEKENLSDLVKEGIRNHKVSYFTICNITIIKIKRCQ